MMKHKQLINLFQFSCKIQNPINLKMNRKKLKNFTSQSTITQMFQNFMIFIYSSVIFFVVCFFLQPYILIIYESIKFQKQYLSSWPSEKKSTLAILHTAGKPWTVRAITICGYRFRALWLGEIKTKTKQIWPRGAGNKKTLIFFFFFFVAAML